MRFKVKLKDEMTIEDLELFYEELEEFLYFDGKGQGFTHELTGHKKKIDWIFEKAVKNNDTGIIENLLESGVKVDVLNESKQTALHLAYHQENYKLIDLLFSYSNNNVNFTSTNGLSHFHVACAAGNLKIVERFLNLGVDVNLWEALHYAVKHHELEIAELLLKRGADVNSGDVYSQTLLHLSCGLPKSMKKLRFLLREGGNCEDLTVRLLNLIKLLVNHGADVNATDSFGNTPLFYIFLENCSSEFVSQNERKMLKDAQKLKLEYLLLNQASVKVGNADGDTVLHLALKKTRDREIVELLLQHGADPNAANKSKETPLKLSVSLIRLDLVELLLKYDADVRDVQFDFFPTDVLPNLETVQNVLKIVDLLNEKGLRMSRRHNLAILKFFVANNADCRYADAEDKNTRAKLKNLLELGTDSNIISVMSKFPLNISDCTYEFQITKKLMIYEIYKHLNLVEQSEIFLSQEVAKCLRAKALSLEKYLLPIYSSSTFDQNLCRYDVAKLNEEIEKMKIIVTSKSTLHDLLKLNPGRICVNVPTVDFKSEFPICNGVIRGYFAKNLVRRYVSESAKEQFRVLVGINLPDLCCDEIFKYLSNECLFDLCLASQI